MLNKSYPKPSTVMINSYNAKINALMTETPFELLSWSVSDDTTTGVVDVVVKNTQQKETPAQVKRFDLKTLIPATAGEFAVLDTDEMFNVIDTQYEGGLDEAIELLHNTTKLNHVGEILRDEKVERTLVGLWVTRQLYIPITDVILNYLGEDAYVLNYCQTTGKRLYESYEIVAKPNSIGYIGSAKVIVAANEEGNELPEEPELTESKYTFTVTSPASEGVLAPTLLGYVSDNADWQLTRNGKVVASSEYSDEGISVESIGVGEYNIIIDTMSNRIDEYVFTGIGSYLYLVNDEDELGELTYTIKDFGTSVSGFKFQLSYSHLNVPAKLPKHVIDIESMFRDNSLFNYDLSHWDVSHVENMSSAFENCVSFNQDISGWNVNGAWNLDSMFYGCENFDQDLSSWCVSKIFNAPSYFTDSLDESKLPVWGTCPRGEDNGIPVVAEPPIGYSVMKFDTYNNTAQAAGLIEALPIALKINGQEGRWVLYESGVRVADSLNPELELPLKNECHYELHIKRGGISLKATGDEIDVLQIVQFADSPYQYKFKDTTSTLIVPEVFSSKVWWTSNMFENCIHFNQDISMWDVSNVNSMGAMFKGAVSFNQNISNWDVSKVTDMANMFEMARAFNQNLSGWCVTKIKERPTSFSRGVLDWHMSKPIWGTCTNVAISDDIRNEIVKGFKFTITSTTDSYIVFKLPLTNDTGVYEVYENNELDSKSGGMSSKKVTYTSNLQNDNIEVTTVANETATYVLVTPQVTDLSIAPGYDFDGDINIEEFSETISSYRINAGDCNLTVPSSIPSTLTSMVEMFRGSRTFNQDISSWDVSNVTDMSDMFHGAKAFNQDISGWNVSQVTSMRGMFNGATIFNRDLSQWCVPKVTDSWNQGNFDTLAIAWTLPRPVWGTCPRGEDGSVVVTPESTPEWTVVDWKIDNFTGDISDASRFSQEKVSGIIKSNKAPFEPSGGLSGHISAAYYTLAVGEHLRLKLKIPGTVNDGTILLPKTVKGVSWFNESNAIEYPHVAFSADPNDALKFDEHGSYYLLFKNNKLELKTRDSSTGVESTTFFDYNPGVNDSLNIDYHRKDGQVFINVAGVHNLAVSDVNATIAMSLKGTEVNDVGGVMSFTSENVTDTLVKPDWIIASVV